MNTPHLTTLLEALLFAADRPLTLAELHTYVQQGTAADTAGLTPDEVAAALTELEATYQAQQRAFGLRQVAGGFQLLTRPELAPWLKPMLQAREPRRLSRSALETLAIVAYKQPITRPEIDYLRGVQSDYALQRLMEKQLIEPAGRAALPGKPLLYRTSSAFLEHFGLDSLNDLPKLKELLPDEISPARPETATAEPPPGARQPRMVRGGKAKAPPQG